MPNDSTRRKAAPLPRPRSGEPPLPYVPRPTRLTYDNGLRLCAARWGALPQVALRLVMRAGAMRDPAAFPGIAGLVGRLVGEGTEHHSAEALNARLDLLGAALDVNVGHDFAEVELLLLSETLEEALPLLAEIVTQPRFPEHEVERARHEVLDSIEARGDEPANVADDCASEAVFGPDHPYGRLALGTSAGIRAIGRNDLQQFHRSTYLPDGAVLVAAGDLDVDRFAALLEHAFRDWRGTPADPRISPVAARPRAAGERLMLPWNEAEQAELRIAGTGLKRSSPDWIAAAVANYVLGGSTITGRLGANLREDKGWTYGARSSFSAGVEAGGWMAETAVDVDVRDAALEQMAAEIRRLVDEPVSEEELHRAQNALVLSLPRAFETPGRVVSRFATTESFGLPENYWEAFPAAVRAVTPEAIRDVAGGLFAPGELVTVSVG